MRIPSLQVLVILFEFLPGFVGLTLVQLGFIKGLEVSFSHVFKLLVIWRKSFNTWFSIEKRGFVGCLVEILHGLFFGNLLI
jgi:hypothetical protein